MHREHIGVSNWFRFNQQLAIDQRSYRQQFRVTFHRAAWTNGVEIIVIDSRRGMCDRTKTNNVRIYRSIL